jgi:hypothetical protein
VPYDGTERGRSRTEGWDRLEDHTEGFRGSEDYQRWRDLLHHFYDPAPTVEHYEPVFEVARPV